jgi:hypothetical protein
VHVVRLGRPSGGGDGWGGDLLLREDYPDEIEVDATALGNVVPIFLLRLATFIRWHVAQGRSVVLKWPADPLVGAHLSRMRLADCLPPESIRGFDGEVPPADNVVLPITQISKPTEIDALADPLLDVVTGHAGSGAALGPAFHMAVSELCGNAVEHGANPTGAFVTAQRYEGPPRLSLAIADLGVGIPEHVRQQFPEWHDDAGAIANATHERVSGTGSPERGFGFAEIFREALATAMNAAEMNIRSCRGHVTIRATDDRVVPAGWATPYKRGSWISYELVAAR